MGRFGVGVWDKSSKEKAKRFPASAKVRLWGSFLGIPLLSRLA